jgi:hypothetical protein
MVLLEELVEEVLLRLPPADHASLVRAAIVCKPWCRIISDRRFRRRFSEFHRSPPMLGLLCNFRDLLAREIDPRNNTITIVLSRRRAIAFRAKQQRILAFVEGSRPFFSAKRQR